MKALKQNYNNKIIFFIFLISLGLSNSYATNYYISSSGGDDSNDGLSTNSPWKSVNKILIKSLSAQKFQSGDQILLKSGDVWEGQIRLLGSANNSLTISKYGTGGNPIIYGDYHSLTWTEVSGHTGIYSASVGQNVVLSRAYEETSNLTPKYAWGLDLTDPDDLDTFLNGFSSGCFGPYGNTNTVYVQKSDDSAPDDDVKVFVSAVVDLAGEGTYITIENLDLRNGNYGILVDNCDNITVSNNSLQDMLNLGVYIRYGSTGCLVDNNKITRTGNDALYVYEAVDTTFSNNTISHVIDTVLGITTSGDQCAIGLQESTGTIVEYNNVSDIPLGSGVDFYYEEDAIVRYNYFQDTKGGAYPHGTDIAVYYNIFNFDWDTTSSALYGCATNAANTGDGYVLFYNNILYGTGSYALMSVNAGSVEFYNNIVYGAKPTGQLTNFDGNDVVSENNCFYGNGVFRFGSTNYSTLSAYQSATGLETDSIFSDPEFAFTPHPESALDLQLMTGSACIDNGKDLSSIVSEYLDYLGTSVPQNSVPDIGAYEGAYEGVHFYDTLEGETPDTAPSQWTPAHQDEDYLVKVDDDNVLSLSGETYQYAKIMASTGSNQWEDYEIKLKFKYVETTQGSNGYILFLYAGASAPGAYIRLQTGTSSATLEYKGLLPDGSQPKFPGDVSYITQNYSSAGFSSLSADTWYQIRIVADGENDEVIVYICEAGDEENEVEIFNTSVVLNDGSVGLAVWTNEMYFDDIKIKSN